MAERKTIEVERLVMPDLADNPSPGPRGWPIAFGDVAYFFPAAVKDKRTEPLRDKVNALARMESEPPAAGSDMTAVLDLRIETVCAALACQYSEAAISAFLDEVVGAGKMDLEQVQEVMAAAMMNRPDYDIVVKKKP